MPSNPVDEARQWEKQDYLDSPDTHVYTRGNDEWIELPVSLEQAIRQEEHSRYEGLVRVIEYEHWTEHGTSNQDVAIAGCPFPVCIAVAALADAPTEAREDAE